MTKVEKLEQRIADLEGKIAMMEERRSRIIPKALLDDPNIEQLCRDHVQSAVKGWKLCLAQNGRNLAEARFVEAARQAERELDQKTKEAKEHEAAEVSAAVRFWERTGQSPPGYEISVEPDFETFSRPPQPGG
jgi:hypothetical protein